MSTHVNATVSAIHVYMLRDKCGKLGPLQSVTLKSVDEAYCAQGIDFSFQSVIRIMSSHEDTEILKGGHPPAVKAGGMRITQHKTPKEEREAKPGKDSEESKPSTSPPKTMMISGVPARGNADFPPEAVQHFHEKPAPTHDARPAHFSRPICIQQPRK